MYAYLSDMFRQFKYDESDSFEPSHKCPYKIDLHITDVPVTNASKLIVKNHEYQSGNYLTQSHDESGMYLCLSKALRETFSIKGTERGKAIYIWVMIHV